MPGAAPVSDRSLHLWLSAVLGVWMGMKALLTLSISLPIQIGQFPSAYDYWRWSYWTLTILLASLVAVSSPSEPRWTARLGNLTLSLMISFVCATVLSAGDVGLGGTLSYSAIDHLYHAYACLLHWYGPPLLLVRLPAAWALILFGSLIFRLAFRRFAVPGPTQCRVCRFDQAGLPPHDTCPECGSKWKAKPATRAQASARTVRWTCRIVVLFAVSVRIAADIPCAILEREYRRLDMASSGGWVQIHGLRGGRTVMHYSILEAGERVVTLELVLETPGFFGLGSQGSPKLTSRLYTDNPDWNQSAQPFLDQEGLIPKDTIQRLIDAPPNPPRSP